MKYVPRLVPADTAPGDGWQPGAMPEHPDDVIDTLARTIWGEAGNRSLPAMEAVAAVVMNRVAAAKAQGGHWWGDSVGAVCLSPDQFATWAPDGPMRQAAIAVTPADPVFAVCRRIARRAMEGTLDDPTGGATRYHAEDAGPDWSQGRSPSAAIGGLLFYADTA